MLDTILTGCCHFVVRFCRLPFTRRPKSTNYHTYLIESLRTTTPLVFVPGVNGIVPQDDRLHGFFTVKSYMLHYARLTGMPHTPELDQNIEELIKNLGLTDETNTIVGDLFFKGLSGGQKRRLSIGLEALTSPINLYLDEPTSGLDSESALKVMEFLKTYVRAAPGRRVILTIHQPSTNIWQLIDNTVLLSKGRLMYQGSRSAMEEYFASVGTPTPSGWNPADHYVTMVNDDFRESVRTVAEWEACFQKWEDDQAKAEADGAEGGNARRGKSRTPSMLAASGLQQIHTTRSSSVKVVLELTYRYFLNLWFNPGILATRIAMYTMLALMVGALFWGIGDQDDYTSILSRSAISFYCVAFFVFMSVAVLPFTVMERDIVDKEVLNRYYHPIMYQLSQGLTTIPSAALLAFITSLIVCAMLKLNDPFWYFLNMFLALMVAEALAQMISHIVPHFVIGMALLAGLFGFFMLMMGFMIVPSDFPLWLKWTNKIAFHTYSWRSFMVTEFRGETFSDGPFATGEEVLATYEIEDVDRTNDVSPLQNFLVSFAYTFLLFILHYVIPLLPFTSER